MDVWQGKSAMTRKKVTVYELADACGVSTATISRVVNGHKNVRPATRERVFGEMKRLGYHPSAAARALSMGRSQVISVWIGNLNSRYVTAFLVGLEQHLAQVSYEMMLRNLWHRPLEEVLPPVNADGIIVVDEPEWIEKVCETPPRLRTPLVSLGKNWVSSVDHVGLDLTDAARDAYRHLASVGCKRIAYVAPRGRNNVNNVQYRAYHDSAAQAGRTPEVIETPWIGDRAKVEETMETYLASHTCPDGLICHNDDHAIAACRVLRRHQLRVPEDVAVVGCNGIQETEYLEHPLSTIVLPVSEACKTAWDILENRMRDPDLPIQSVVLKPQLQVRASSMR